MKIIFKNEAELNFQDEIIKQNMSNALTNFRKGEKFPLIIGSEKRYTDEENISINPGKKSEILGYTSKASIKDAEDAMKAASEAFKTWKFAPSSERIKLAQRVIEIMQRERYNLNATIIEESGKNWGEADGEVCETIDFINAYSVGVQELEKGVKLQDIPTEKNQALYIPIGVGVIISPWNFPLALMAGMVISAIITGNTVVVKPASQTPITAYKFIEILEEAGFPKGVVNLLFGNGGEIGNYLVEHLETRFINFTGSKEVGLNINKRAALTSDKWIKRIVSEMGGKNAIIVDKSADLNQAAEGVAISAFHFQGQKCSACSRAIVHADVYEEFLDRLVDYTKNIQMGLGKDNITMGPVISQSAYNSITKYIEIGRSEGKIVYGGTYDDSEGFYIKPTIIRDIKHGDRVSVEEIFGPVLAVIKVSSFDEALEIANDTEYGLAGSVYSQDEENLNRAKAEFLVGNLYLNRKSTGAVVQQHPFGGYNMSGTAAKSGTTDYLYNFIQMKSIARKLIS